MKLSDEKVRAVLTCGDFGKIEEYEAIAAELLDLRSLTIAQLATIRVQAKLIEELQVKINEVSS